MQEQFTNIMDTTISDSDHVHDLIISPDAPAEQPMPVDFLEKQDLTIVENIDLVCKEEMGSLQNPHPEDHFDNDLSNLNARILQVLYNLKPRDSKDEHIQSSEEGILLPTQMPTVKKPSSRSQKKKFFDPSTNSFVGESIKKEYKKSKRVATQGPKKYDF